ncbi:PREDICTED: allatostatin [Papilio xuthus]|uniref:Allatostatin n=1 Tax=Papilio xuthus TaxID=66420 RepID=A0AAJ7E673_PAPXU|nr:PREDICTED: allatostatin [Papilio xuthus]
MNSSANYNILFILLVSSAFFFATTRAAPLESEEEQSENALVSRPEAVDMTDMSAPWDPITAAALRKLLVQLDAEERLTRVGRSWPQNESRGWGLRAMDGRLAKQWRADKRQVRFRQCYFNPISCFRK